MPTQVVVQQDLPSVNVESVETLYAKFERMDVPGYYEEGQENPWAGLTRIIPRTARAYAVVPIKDIATITLAQALLKGIGGRRKIKFAIRHKGEVNYQMFAPAGKVTVLYV